MVNVGGPSRGCLTCIRRKIRCDRQKPQCQQCRGSKRTCEGYRDSTDILFRDQSRQVASKVQAVQNDQYPPSTTVATSRRSSTTHNAADTEAKLISHEPPIVSRSPKLDQDRGLIDFFANNFTCSGSVEMRSNLFWVPRDLNELLKDESAELSLQCVGAMALARLRRSPEYMREAQKRYSSALLNLAEKSLRTSETKGPPVFIAILLLSFFEILASYDHSSSQSWQTHLNGLGALCKRGNQQTEIDPRIFRQIRSQVLIGAMQSHTTVSEPFSKRAPTIEDPMLPDFQYFDDADELLIRLAALRAQRRAVGPTAVLLVGLKVLAEDLRQWERSLPARWSFSTQPHQWEPDWWWDARCDIFSSGFVAHTWNKIRAAQIITYDMIQDTSSFVSWVSADAVIIEPDQSDQDRPTPRMKQLVTDICATIPPYYRPRPAGKGLLNESDQPLIGTVFWFLWVLEVVGSMNEAPPELRDWIVQCFERMYETTGVIKTRLVAERLKRGQSGPVLL